MSGRSERPTQQGRRCTSGLKSTAQLTEKSEQQSSQAEIPFGLLLAGEAGPVVGQKQEGVFPLWTRIMHEMECAANLKRV